MFCRTDQEIRQGARRIIARGSAGSASRGCSCSSESGLHTEGKTTEMLEWRDFFEHGLEVNGGYFGGRHSRDLVLLDAADAGARRDARACCSRGPGCRTYRGHRKGSGAVAGSRAAAGPVLGTVAKSVSVRLTARPRRRATYYRCRPASGRSSRASAASCAHLDARWRRIGQHEWTGTTDGDHPYRCRRDRKSVCRERV